MTDIQEDGQVYLMSCHGYYYIGVHIGDIFSDNYYGSGIAWTNVINKYGISDCTRVVLETFHSRNEKNELERKYIKEYRKIYGKRCLNIADGGEGGNLGDLVNEKISKSVSGTGNGMYGKKLSEKSKQLISNALIGHPNYNHGGYHHTDDAKLRIGIAHKGMKVKDSVKIRLRYARLNQKNVNLKGSSGCSWYHSADDKKEAFFETDDTIPEGWIKGRKRQLTKGKIYCTNGIIEILVEQESDIPAGFRKGRKSRTYSEERNKKISNSLKNHKKSDSAKLKLSLANKGKHWYTNGVDSIQSHNCPEGWKLGRTSRKKVFENENA